jgi:hypothetical protein
MMRRIVKAPPPAADKEFVKKAVQKGRGLRTTSSVKMRFAELDLMKKLPFKFLHKVVLPQQIARGSGDVSICFGMTTQGSGLGLHVAYEMGVEGGELYLARAYIDGQKVTNKNEVLMRLSSYLHLERSMLTIASGIVGSESEASVAEFLYKVKKQSALGFEGGRTDQRGTLKANPPFNFNPWKICSDAAGGPKLAWLETFGCGRGDGRGEWVQCEMHFRKAQKNAETLLGEKLKPEHQLLVREWLLSESEKEWKASFDRLQDWYEKILEGESVVQSKMRN